MSSISEMLLKFSRRVDSNGVGWYRKNYMLAFLIFIIIVGIYMVFK